MLARIDQIYNRQGVARIGYLEERRLSGESSKGGKNFFGQLARTISCILARAVLINLVKINK